MGTTQSISDRPAELPPAYAKIFNKTFYRQNNLNDLAMPRIFYFILLFSMPVWGSVSNRAALPPAEAKCMGKDPCNACSNCSSCKYCAGGGSCGVCKKKPAPAKAKAPVPSKQCKAKTKKGIRCSRVANASGFCWQHEKP